AIGSCASAATATIRSRAATPARRGDRCPGCITIRTASSARSCASATGSRLPRGTNVWTISRAGCARSPTATGPRRSGCSSGGVGMDAAGYRMAEALHAALGRPPRFSPLTIDGTAKVLIAWQIGGFPGLSAHVDYARARLVVLVGSNPIVSHGHNNGLTPSAIRALRRRAEVWVLDPRHTETARLATRHLAPRPGTDYAVLAYLVREVLRDGADREVLERRALGIEALAAAVEPFALARAARVADVPEAELTELLGAVRP